MRFIVPLSLLIGAMEMVIPGLCFLIPGNMDVERWAGNIWPTHPPDKSARKSKAAKLPICPQAGSDWDKMARRIEGRLIDIDKT